MELNKLETAYDLVFIIDALPTEDRKDFQLTEFIQMTLTEAGIPFAVARCKSATEVVAAFHKMLEFAKQGHNMCLQVVSHGTDEGIYIDETDETVTWSTISPILVSINGLMGGTLLINMTTCEGLNGMKMIDVSNESSPFFGLIGCNRLLRIWEARITNKFFYEKLIQGQDIAIIVPEIQQELKRMGNTDNAIYSISSEGYKQIVKEIISRRSGN